MDGTVVMCVVLRCFAYKIVYELFGKKEINCVNKNIKNFNLTTKTTTTTTTIKEYAIKKLMHIFANIMQINNVFSKEQTAIVDSVALAS